MVQFGSKLREAEEERERKSRMLFEYPRLPGCLANCCLLNWNGKNREFAVFAFFFENNPNWT